MSFTFSVVVDGTDIAEVVPSGDVTISYGRRSLMDTHAPTSATVEIITKDAPDFRPSMGYNLPEFGLGNHSMVSGFVDDYRDNYEGSISRITLGASVSIGAHTESGFVDEYADGYTSGADWTRMVGTIAAIDYDPDRITLTVVDNTALLGRETVTPAWPTQSDYDRAHEIYPTIVVYGPPCLNVAADQSGKTTTVLKALQALASDVDGIVVTSRDGEVQFRTRDDWTREVTLPPEVTLLAPLTMTTELGLVVNSVSVEYGETNDRHVLTDARADSIAQYGLSEKTYNTTLATATDAQAFADSILDLYSVPHWSMPTAVVDMALADDAVRGLVCDLDLGDTVHVPRLLAGSPEAAFSAEVLGVTETLSVDHWRVTIHLAPTLAPLTRRRSA